MKDFLTKIIFFLLIVVFVALTVWLATIEPEGAFREFVLRYGYFGFFLTAFVGGLNFIVPFSHLIFIVPLLSSGLGLWVLILLGAIGTTCADAVGYGVGRTGGSAFRVFDHIKTWGEKVITRYPKLAPVILIVWASFVPFPNEIFVIPAGFVRYGFLRTLSITFLGNLVFNFLAVRFGSVFVM